MSSAIDICFVRIRQEEGFRSYPYDDATGSPVKAPQGNISWLYGVNLETEGTMELGEVIVRWKLNKIQVELSNYSWYMVLDEMRRSVLLDIAYNAGVKGLLGFPSMLHYLSVQNYEDAALQCSVKPSEPPGVIDRYKRLAEIIRTGTPTP